MFDTSLPELDSGTTVPVPDPLPDPDPDPTERVPLERLEAQICQLAGHLTAATCRFLVMLADFDTRRGWASWDMTSCAQWLSWKCQMSSGTAREHVRVARALRELPVIREQFAAARLSYAKVRALTRIATPETEKDLAEMAGPMTGNQLERFARAHRKVTRAEDVEARLLRRVAWRFEDDGSLSGTFRLPPLEGAALLQALRAATGDLEHPHDNQGSAAAGVDVSAETSRQTSSSLADALVAIAEAYLAGKSVAADNADVYQVIVHVGTDAPGTGDAGPTAPARAPGHPADPARCHVEDGPAIRVSTADMLTCTATLSWMLHDHDGAVLDVGRRSRKPSAALRRAVRERDNSRCRYPGCESRRVDLHHIRYWSNGGKTTLTNLICLCKRHHMQVHDRGYLIAACSGGAFAFRTLGGEQIPASPQLPESAGSIEDCHDAEILPDTIIPAWYGERLDLDYAIATCFANADNNARKQAAPGSRSWQPAINHLNVRDINAELRAIQV
jgi:5-methylcytosine-specific restriction endonuclease McrA